MALSGLSPVALERFSGLRLDVDPEEVGSGAVDDSNVIYDQTGSRAGSRWGSSTVVTFPALSNPETIVNYTTSGGIQRFFSNNIIVGGVSAYALMNSGGTVIASAAQSLFVSDTGRGFSWTRFGTPTASRLYIADNETVRMVEDPTISAVVFTGANPASARYVCATSDARVAYLAPSTNPDRVYFSSPGDPATVPVNNYVDLSPGDGQLISGAVLYRDQFIVFKERKFFVFYGTSTDGSGNPIFNYRTVDTGVGAQFNYYGPSGVCVGRDGAYFTDGQSIYRTTGSEPLRISSAVDPFLQRDTLPLFNHTKPATDPAILLRWADERLYIIVRRQDRFYSTYLVFVWHSKSGLWSSWDIPATDLIPGRTIDEKLVGVDRAGRRIFTLAKSLTTDSGTAISSSLQSGFMDLGSPGAEKVIRETQITGQGTINFGWARDFSTAPTLSAVTLGTAPAVTRGLHRVAQQGETLSYRITATGPWQVNRIVPMVRSVRGAGERTT